jgi:putative sterol carrier protein
VYAGAGEGPLYGDGPAPAEPDALLALDTATCTALSRGELDLVRAVREGRVQVTGEGALAKALREA